MIQIKDYTVKDMWESYVEKVFKDEEISKIQYSEMQKAFYSGAWAAFCLMVELSSDNVSEETGAEMFENWRQEVLDFSKMIMKK